MKPIETVDKCTTCSTCVAYCPVTKATRAFKGPKLTGPSSERFRLYDETGGGEISEIEALDYCSNCKNCDIACPSGVKISTLNMLARAEYCKRHKPPLRDWVLSHGRMLGRLARRFPPKGRPPKEFCPVRGRVPGTTQKMRRTVTIRGALSCVAGSSLYGFLSA